MVVVKRNRHVWKQAGRNQRQWYVVGRYLSLFGFLGMAFTASAILFRLVSDPFHHPRVEFLFFSGSDLPCNLDGNFDRFAIAFPTEELAGLERTRQRIFGPLSQPSLKLEQWKSSSDISSLGEKLRNAKLADNDVAVIEILAGVSVDNESLEDDPCLLLNFGSGFDSIGRVRVEDLLNQIIVNTPAQATKILILDASGIELLSQQDMVMNDFPRQLKKMVQKINHKSLWVICSHGPLETSQMLDSLKRSVFGYYLELGLSGAADQNGDLRIDVLELHRWVCHSVADYIDRRSGGMQSQIPMLYWGGGDHADREKHPDIVYPLIVPVRPNSMTVAMKTVTLAAEKNSENVASPSKETNSEGKPHVNQSPISETSPGVPELISEAWELLKTLQSRQHELSTAPAANDLVPQMMGALTQLLIRYESLSATAEDRVSAELHQKLIAIVTPLRGILSTPPVPPPEMGTGLGARIARNLSPSALPSLPIRSLALAERLAMENIQPLPERISELGQAMDKWILQDDRTGFDEWIETIQPSELALVELQGLIEIARIPHLDWPLLKNILLARRSGERAAVEGFNRRGMVDRDLKLGDDRRISAEKILVDSVQPNRYRLAAVDLAESHAAYGSAQRRAKTYLLSVHLKQDLLVQARDFVRWRRLAAQHLDRGKPDFEDVETLLIDLKAFCDVMERQSPDEDAEIAELSSRLQNHQRRIKAAATDEMIDGLASSVSEPQQIDQMEVLLQTPFVSPDRRLKLRNAAMIAATQVALDVRPHGAQLDVTEPRTVRQRQRECIREHVRLELLLAELAEIPEWDGLPFRGSLDDLQTAAKNVEEFQYSILQQSSREEDCDAWSESCRDFGHKLQAWSDQLPGRFNALISKLSDGRIQSAQAAKAWRGVPRIVTLMPTKRSQTAVTDESIGRLRLADWRERFAFLARRAESATRDTALPQREYLIRLAEDYRLAALAIDPYPLDKSNSIADMRLTGVAELSLAEEYEGELLLTVENRRSEKTTICMSMDYDSELIEIRPPTDCSVLREVTRINPDKPRMTPAIFGDPIDPKLIQSFELKPGAERVLKFGVRRLGSRSWPTKLIVKALTIENPDCVLRHEFTIRIPSPETIEFIVAGPERSWTEIPGGFVLHPFPNQRTVFQYLLRNQGLPRVLDLELFPLESRMKSPLPQGTLAQEHAEKLLGTLSLGPRLAFVSNFRIDGDGIPRTIPFQGPPPPNPDQPPVTEKELITPGVRELPFGALLRITEPLSGAQILKQIEFAPQRPQRYVQSRVEYQPDSQLIHVVVRRQAHFASPPRIKVRCELHAIPATSPPRRPAVGEIGKDDTEVRIVIPVPGEIEHWNLSIAIDDYPRAFRYKFFPATVIGEIPEDVGELAIRMKLPVSTGLYACPLKMIQAFVEVDAPPGSLAEDQGFWEIGIDKNLDRELAGETALRLTTDRQSRPKLSGYLPDGRIAIDNQVGDFQVRVPAEGLCNQRALMVTHARVWGRDAWGIPLELVLDGTGPRIAAVALGPDRMLLSGKELEVGATVLDGGLSGVSQVEVGFDSDGTGFFAKDPPPVLATHAQNEEWIARLSTEKMPPGYYQVLLRATDNVGNTGEFQRKVFRLFSKEELEQQRSSVRVTVRGVVEFETFPAPDVKVKLIPVDPDPKPTSPQVANPAKTAGGRPSPAVSGKGVISGVRTDKDGLFAFSDVPPGQFKLQVEGIIRNKIRKAEQVITVDEQTPLRDALRFKLP
jgi:hypothetical protein